MSSINNPFAAFKSKNFKYFWLGQCISLIGTWLQNTALSWLALTLTKSAFLIGLFNAVQFTPQLFLSLFAGAIADHFPKKKLLILTQSLLYVSRIFVILFNMEKNNKLSYIAYLWFIFRNNKYF